jgi:hypothetical protein
MPLSDFLGAISRRFGAAPPATVEEDYSEVAPNAFSLFGSRAAVFTCDSTRGSVNRLALTRECPKARMRRMRLSGT